MLYGILHVVSLVYLTGVVALILGMNEGETPREATRHVLGCWSKILGGLVGLGLVVYVLSLFAGE
ncbi:hypothetical protein JW916_00890 [Candidatus Sumerlaeota bacterium]|nr:hypothetical protein [Candidatus Sumerlaeota bacterium]